MKNEVLLAILKDLGLSALIEDEEETLDDLFQELLEVARDEEGIYSLWHTF